MTRYLYTGSEVIMTADSAGAKLTENVLDPSGQIITSQRFDVNGQSQGWYAYNYDIRQSTTAIINNAGISVTSYTYDEFGNLTNSPTSFLNEVQFTGAVSDTNTGLYYMNARYYNPTTGRFLTQDTYKGSAYEPWTQHLYTYCGNNPINLIDPTGYWPEVTEEPWWHKLNEKSKQHDAVQVAMVALLGGVPEVKVFGGARSGRTDTYGYIDVVAGSQAWEIKPDTAYGKNTGDKQLQNYIDKSARNGQIYFRGRDLSEELPSVPYDKGQLDLRYENGVVYYKYNEDKKENKKETQKVDAKDVAIIAGGAILFIAGWFTPGIPDGEVAGAAIIASVVNKIRKGKNTNNRTMY